MIFAFGAMERMRSIWVPTADTYWSGSSGVAR